MYNVVLLYYNIELTSSEYGKRSFVFVSLKSHCVRAGGQAGSSTAAVRRAQRPAVCAEGSSVHISLYVLPCSSISGIAI